MTRDEAMKRINDIRRIYARYVEIVTENENEALDMAINSLKKQENILNKIRAEIEELKPNNPNFKGYFEQNVALNKVLEIIDKYMKEVRD